MRRSRLTALGGFGAGILVASIMVLSEYLRIRPINASLSSESSTFYDKQLAEAALAFVSAVVSCLLLTLAVAITPTGWRRVSISLVLLPLLMYLAFLPLYYLAHHDVPPNIWIEISAKYLWALFWAMLASLVASAVLRRARPSQ